MDILHSLTPYLEPHEADLQNIYSLATTFIATILLGSSLMATLAPTTFADMGGLPLIEPLYNEANKAVFGQLQAASRAARGWIVLFAAREFALGASVLALNRVGQFQALSLVVQITHLIAVGDTYGVWAYGVKGGYKMHLFSSLALTWIGPLGLWLYWR